MLRPLILLIALAAGGGAAWIASRETATVIVTPEPDAIEMTAILVAAQDVPRGGEVTTAALRWQQWPNGVVPATFIERTARPDAFTEVAGQFANRAISTGEPIANHVLSQTPGGFLANMLSPGKRAVGIHASPQSTAGGFILPNDRVDVLHTIEAVRTDDGTATRSRTILRSVRVLAIDQTTDDTDSGTVLGKTATLELTEAQAEAVTTAQATGTLSLSLRPMVAEPGEASMMEIEEQPPTIRIRRGNIVDEVVTN